MKLRIAILSLVWLVAAPNRARAEEGLFIAKAAGGVSSAEHDRSNPGGVVTAKVDLAISERTGPVAGFSLVLNDRYDTVGLHLGVKHLLREREWTRLYLFAAPEILFVWDREDEGGAKRDVALHAGIGYEYLMMWGLGLVFELQGTLPAGLSDSDRYEAASAGFTVGLFTEF